MSNNTLKNSEMTNDETLKAILMHLERMDKRDRVRLWTGTIRSILSIIPTILFFGGLWYVGENIDVLLQKVAKAAVSATTQTAPAQGSIDLWNSLWKQ